MHLLEWEDREAVRVPDLVIEIESEKRKSARDQDPASDDDRVLEIENLDGIEIEVGKEDPEETEAESEIEKMTRRSTPREGKF